MACNCATKEQIDALYRKYGEKKVTAKNATLKAKLKNAAVKVGVVICLIPILPALFLYVTYKAFFDDDKRINMTKFFRLDNNKMVYVGN